MTNIGNSRAESPSSVATRADAYALLAHDLEELVNRMEAEQSEGIVSPEIADEVRDMLVRAELFAREAGVRR